MVNSLFCVMPHRDQRPCVKSEYFVLFIDMPGNRMSFPRADVIPRMAWNFNGAIQRALESGDPCRNSMAVVFLQDFIMSNGLTFDLDSNGTRSTILSISRDEQDHSSLQTIFSQWDVLRAADLSAAHRALPGKNISVVVCDCDSTLEDWTEILADVQQMPVPPSVIITSRLADDRLWSQALNLGAWDVLAKPFDTAEVVRTLRNAWEHWRNQHRVRPTAKALSAAG